MFLVILLVITFIAAKVISPKVKRLTADGESLLEKLRLKHETARRAASTAEADTPDEFKKPSRSQAFYGNFSCDVAFGG